jgi:hypothetical protein
MTTSEVISIALGAFTGGGALVGIIYSNLKDKVTRFEVVQADCRKRDDDSHRILYGRLADLDKVAATIPDMGRRLGRLENGMDESHAQLSKLLEGQARMEATLEASDQT